MRGVRSVVILLALHAGAFAQTDEWLRDLQSNDAVTREVARRHLAFGVDLPAARLRALLQNDRVEVVLAAATLLRDRGLALAALRKISWHDEPAIRRAVLPVASDATVKRLFAEGRVDNRVLALFELEDRGLLDDALLLGALRSDVEELAEAACRLVVLERSPFPVAIARRLLDVRKARLRLITLLADRPRARAGPWLEQVLAIEALPLMERVLAINGLPAARIDLKLASVVLRAATHVDIAISNRAGYAAARFPPRLADELVPEVGSMMTAGVAAAALLPCLERISVAGEHLLLEQALAAEPTVRRAIFDWLSSRESKLVDEFVARALDGKKPFPPGLLRLSSAGLSSPARIGRVAEFLYVGGRTSIDAYSALIEAEVYHPAMLEFAMAEVAAAEGRRLWQLLNLPRGKLPANVFATTLGADDPVACTYAINSLARATLPQKLEPRILEFAETTPHGQLQLAAGRALILWGTEAGGRRAFVAMAKAEHRGLAIRWLTEKTKPWSYEILLKERERLSADQTEANRATLHRVLIALAKLGDRGANAELVREIPRLGPEAMRQAQKLMGRFLKKADLVGLAQRYLKVRTADPDEGLDRAHDLNEERRVELLEWFLACEQLDLAPILDELWRKDGSYEVRLVALRGLLAIDSEKLHGRLYELLSKPYGVDQKDLAFEIVGGGLGEPITNRGLELLAHIVLRAPLTDPRQEIAASLDRGHGSARGAYPILLPAVNLLRRAEAARPRAAFARVAAKITARRFALNRQRLGLFLAGISRREALADQLGPVIGKLILAAPDLAIDYVGPAEMVLADAAERTGEFGKAAELYDAASRAWSRGLVPGHIRRSFLGAADPVVRYHPIAALAARAPICRARAHIGGGRMAAAKNELLRARDLAEGDIDTIVEIATLRKATDR